MKTFLRSALAFVLLAICTVSSAQTAKVLPAFQSYGGGPLDTVNLGNLDVYFSIPIVNKAGRGSPFIYNLSYDNFVWQPVPSGSTKVWTPAKAWGWSGLAAGIAYVGYSASLSTGNCGFEGQSSYQTWNYSGFYYHDTFGVNRVFGISTSYTVVNGGTQNCPPAGPQPTTPQPTTTSDGSGYTLTATPTSSGTATVVLTSVRGETITVPVLTSPPTGSSNYNSTDSNGNVVSSTNGVFTDTLGTTAISVTGAAPSNTSLTYTAPSGAAASYVVSYKSYTVRTSFGCSNISEYNTPGIYLVDKVTLPDNTYYQFTYEGTNGFIGDVTGRIGSVTLPTGGKITYTYPGNNGGIVCSDGTAVGLTRQLDTATAWGYARSLVSGSNWQTTVTDPTTGANQTVINFQKDGTSGSPNYYETERLTYQGSSTSGTLLSTIFTCFNTSVAPSSCPTTAVSSPISTQAVYTYLPNASGSEAETAATYLFGSPSYPTEVDVYDFGTGQVGPLLRRTSISWGGGQGPAVPSFVDVYDGNGAQVQNISYLYDRGTVAPTSGTPQHVSVTNPRGNPTSITMSASNSVALYRVFTYYDTGTLKTATDQGISSTGGPNVTTYNYSSGSCGNSFVTSINEPLSLSRSFTWNCTGGVMTAVTDENSKSTSLTFSDTKFWRPASSSDQLSPANVTNYSYPSSTAVESSLLFNSNISTVDLRATVDDFGRPSISQGGQTPSPTAYDSVETDYDVVGRVADTTQPYSAGASTPCSGTCPKTAFTFDAMNRTLVQTDAGTGTITLAYTNSDVLRTVGPHPAGENTKQRQLEYDGLGRVKSVCEVTSTTGSGTCGQINTQTGFWTKYTYDGSGHVTGVTQNAQASSGNQQTRTYAFDEVGRLTSELNPETGTSAITYTYDTLTSDASCGTVTSAGDMLKKVDAMGNVSCYKYDALHRVTSITYPTGTYASATPTKCFVYDAATVNGTAMQNAKGRVGEAYTTASTCTASKITDEGFSYTARGQASDVWQSTPNSSGYYHLTAQYWANYNLEQLSGLPGLPTMTYGADSEGRPNTVTAGSGQNPVTGASYDVAHHVTGVTYGSLDTDAFTFDPNTGRMTQYQFKMGSGGTTDTGVLTWNPNWSLQKLQITDNIVSANSQTCTYGQDDLMRITSVSCGSTWAQTFSFDPFGNLSKSGSASFLPTYTGTSGTGTSPTNQYYQINGGSAGVSNYYDSNGNLTYDVTHHYTWDADANNISVDGSTVGMTYDAFDRMVEQVRGSAHTQIIYTPLGMKLALMNGQTLVNAFVQLPGGGRAVYNSSGLAYYRHKDHLGSSRLATTPTRAKYYDVAYAPYGEDYNGSGTTADLSFTDQNQDTVAGGWTANLYDFMFREYRTGHGRWTSPDHSGLAAVDPGNPQSWNRYGYVLNNPMSLIDPFGDDCYDKAGNNTGAANDVECAAQGGTWIEVPFQVDVPGGQAPQVPTANVGIIVPDSLQAQELLRNGSGNQGQNGSSSQQTVWQAITHPTTQACGRVNKVAKTYELGGLGSGAAAYFAPVTAPVTVPLGITLGLAGGTLEMYMAFACQ